MKKFELTNTTKIIGAKTLYQIKSLKNFGNVSKGDLGGWIEKEDNLSQNGDARVSGDADIIWISHLGSRYGTTTICRTKSNDLFVSCGCFEGTLNQFEAQIEKTHGNNKFGKEYMALISLVKIHFGI